VRSGERPTTEGELRAYSRDVLLSGQFIGNTHDQFSDIDVSGRQLAFISKLRGDCSDFLDREPPGQQRKERNIVPPGIPWG
jgi:hypothetical protein